MPLYSFHCKNCQINHQVFFKIKEEKVAKCPKCGNFSEKQIKGTGFSISGPGVFKEGFSGYSNKSNEQLGKRYKGD